MDTEHQLKSKLVWSMFQEYEIKTKMVQEHWLQLKMTFLFFLLGWANFWWQWTKNWWGEGEWANFWLVGGLPHPPSRKHPVKTLPTGLYIQWRGSAHITYIMCRSAHLTSARFKYLVCHRYIWYIFSLACSVSLIQ